MMSQLEKFLIENARLKHEAETGSQYWILKNFKIRVSDHISPFPKDFDYGIIIDSENKNTFVLTHGLNVKLFTSFKSLKQYLDALILLGNLNQEVKIVAENNSNSDLSKAINKFRSYVDGIKENEIVGRTKIDTFLSECSRLGL